MWREAFGITIAIVIIIMAWDNIQKSTRTRSLWEGNKLTYWYFMFFGGIFWLVHTLLKLFFS